MVELNESENTERVALQMEMLLRLLVVFAKHFPFLNLQIIGEIPQKQFKCRFMNFWEFPRKTRKLLLGKPHNIWDPSPKIDESSTFYGLRLRLAIPISCICKICQRLSICSVDFSGLWEHFCSFGKSEQPRHWFQSPPSSLILMEVVLWHNLHHNWMKFRENCVFLWLQLISLIATLSPWWPG